MLSIYLYGIGRRAGSLLVFVEETRTGASAERKKDLLLSHGGQEVTKSFAHSGVKVRSHQALFESTLLFSSV